MFVRRSLICEEFGITRRRKTTTPSPPMKWVEDLQKRRLSGSISTFSRMVAPVAVKPETLSNQAFSTLKGPPQRAYGSMPKTKDRSHERTIIMNPSFMVISGVLRTNMKGNIPTMKVMVKLIIRAARALSLPLDKETSIDRNMNNALTSRA